jgi:hypothetical protein
MMWAKQLLVAVLISPFVCLFFVGLYVQMQGWQIYHRIGNYSIGLVTFFVQLQYQGCDFPGPNVLEAQIANQPADLQMQVQVFRRRSRQLRWAAALYIGFFFAVLFLARKLSS